MDQFNRITPKELSAMVEARVKFRDADQRFLDSLNGVNIANLVGRFEQLTKALYATYGQKYEIQEIIPVNFMITRREIENEGLTKKQLDAKMRRWFGLPGEQNDR
jgi:hypothetical protein